MADGRRTSLAAERDRAIARTQVINVELVGETPHDTGHALSG